MKILKLLMILSVFLIFMLVNVNTTESEYTISSSSSSSIGTELNSGIFESLNKHHLKNKIKSKNKIKKTVENKKEPGNDKISWEGWVNYSILDSKIVKDTVSGKTPTKFFKNFNFYKISLNKEIDLKEKKGDHYLHPQTITSFYATLKGNVLNILSDRSNLEQSVYDTVNIQNIMPIAEKTGFSGGIQLVKNSEKCFVMELKSTVNQFYLICTEEKKDMMAILYKIKGDAINNQKKEGKIVTQPVEAPKPSALDLIKTTNDSSSSNSNSDSKSNNKDNSNDKKENNNNNNSSKEKKIDGYWVTLQDWSTCTHKCGGGTQSFHRMCVPPKNGGKPCEGESILKRPCNKEPCPEISKRDSKSKIETAIDGDNKKDTIIKVMPFSSRYQRYTVSFFIN